MGSIHLRLMAIMGLIVMIAALKIGYPVIMPLVAACFIIATAWPIKNVLDRRLPTLLSYIGTVVVLITLFVGFCVLIYFAVSQVATQLFTHQEDFRDLYHQYTGWAQDNGLPLPAAAANDSSGGATGFERLLAFGRSILANVYNLLSYLGLISVIVVMGLPEVPAMVHKFNAHFEGSENRQIFDVVGRIAHQFRSYLTMTVVTSLITGVASSILVLALGMDMALTWGVLNFLLNFVPVVGNIMGIIPPALYAFVQFGGWVMPVVVLISFTVLQLFISNFIYPVLQGRGLSLPPITITLALLFWGWLWGLAGALLAVPLTAAAILIAREFPSTAIFGYLLTRDTPAELDIGRD